MDAERKAKLIEAGIDVDGALERFMGNDVLLEKLLKKFVEDTNYDSLLTCTAGACNGEDAFKAAHTLKGVCGNLSMTTLYELFSKQTELFRSGKLGEAFAMMPEISEAYNKAAAAIKE